MILLPIISSWMGMGGRRRLVQVFPDPVREWWDQWEIRALLLISFVSQIILTLLGKRRKYGTNKIIDSILWCTYLLADGVPAIALGAISSKLGDYYNKHGQQTHDTQLIAFWAPFFLMHVGGPDTITAYSLEDNELWLRHLVGLVVQMLLTLYIILLSWNTTNWVSWLSLPLFIIGCVKYGERTWSLYSASSHYRGDLWLDSYISKTEEITVEKEDYPVRTLMKAHMVSHFSDMVLRTQHINFMKDTFPSDDYEQAFSFVNFIHGLTNDIFYTKSFAAFSVWGCISRLVALLVLVLVLTLHILFGTKNNKYARVDCIITYMLLVGAIISDFLSTILLLVTSEFIVEFFRASVEFSNPFLSGVCNWIVNRNMEKREKWYLIAQCNFFTLLCSENIKFNISRGSLPIRKLENIHNLTPYSVSSDLKRMLFDNVVNKAKESTPIQTQLGPRYRQLIREQRSHWRRLPIENLEFHRSILFWHLVTDICYYCDDNRDGDETAIHSSESKKLSDYMFYLLVKQRQMLPIGTGLPTLRDTLVEAILLCDKRKSLIGVGSDVSEACKTLRQQITEDREYAEDDARGRSVFRYAFVTANEMLGEGSMKEIWDFLIELWIEMLNHGAAQCRVDKHAQQLRYGGEFISHVWTLQLVTGLLEQFQPTRPFFQNETTASV